MAGVPGKSGGRRANTGGARKGAGRKKKESSNSGIDIQKQDDPKKFLILVMNNSKLEMRLRVDAAKSLMPFTYVKKGEGGIKGSRLEAAQKAGSGKFAPSKPPKLKLINSAGE